MLRRFLDNGTKFNGRRFPIVGRDREQRFAGRKHALPFRVANLKHDPRARQFHALVPLRDIHPFAHPAVSVFYYHLASWPELGSSQQVKFRPDQYPLSNDRKVYKKTLQEA